MCSTRGARALPRADCSIQKSPDHRLLPTPRRLSQVAASFFGSWCLGIHLGPLLACSTYNHSSIAEEWFLVTSNFKLERGSSFALLALLKISIDLFGCQCAGGDERARTADPLLAKQVLSQLSYIPWGTVYEPCLWRRLAGASLRVRRTRLRGRLSDLERPEEWERQDLEPRVLFVLFLHSNELFDTDSHRELSRLPSSFDDALARSGRLLFATCLIAHCCAENASLIFANLMTLVTASSDLTSLQTPSRLNRSREGPLYQRVDKEKLLKGGDPATPSGTATLLRLHPPHRALLRRLRPYGLGQRLGEHLRLWDMTGGERACPEPYSPRSKDLLLVKPRLHAGELR